VTSKEQKSSQPDIGSSNRLQKKSERPEPLQSDFGTEEKKRGEDIGLTKTKGFGLPENALWDEYDRATKAKELGLPESTDEIEVERVFEVRRLGLPEGASWIEIYRAWDEQCRVTLAKRLGLQKEYTDYVSWRNILATILKIDVCGPVKMEDIIGEIERQDDKK